MERWNALLPLLRSSVHLFGRGAESDSCSSCARNSHVFHNSMCDSPHLTNREPDRKPSITDDEENSRFAPTGHGKRMWGSLVPADGRIHIFRSKLAISSARDTYSTSEAVVIHRGRFVKCLVLEPLKRILVSK